MEARQPIQFWIISRGEPAGRIEVPVDTSSDIIDIIRPMGDAVGAGDRVQRTRPLKTDLFCESPVDVMDANHIRSISACTVSTTVSAHSTSDELRLPEVGRLASIHDEEWTCCSDGCPSGRSYDSVLDGTACSADSHLDAYATIEEFDSLIKGSLSEIRVRRAYRGRQSLLQDFDVGGAQRAAPDAAGVDRKVFGFTFQSTGSVERTPGESSQLDRVMPKFPGFGDLRRRISRFMSIKSGKQAVRPTPQASQQEIAERAVHVDPGATPANGSAGPVVSNSTPNGPARDDFLVLIPGQK